jgi:murein L,D-transpeptidase YafK
MAAEGAVEQVEETAAAAAEPEAGMAVSAAAAAPAAQVAVNTLMAPRPAPSVRADMIVVNKSARLMHLLHGRQIIRTYRIALGGNPSGHKQYQGDERTPEGVYLIDGRNPNSDFHLSLHISYPRSVDNWYAAAQGNDAGSMIMIHGLPNGWTAAEVGHPSEDWTNGCIAVTNEEIEEIWSLVDDGTTIRIFP